MRFGGHHPGTSGRPLLLLVVASLITVPTARAIELPELDVSKGYLPGQVVVQFGSQIKSETAAANVLETLRARLAQRSLFNKGLYRVQLPAGMDVEYAARQLSSLPQVVFAEPNYLYRLSFNPNDPAFRVQWNFRMVDAPTAWDIQRGSSSVTVAVLDGGVASENLGVFNLDLGILFFGADGVILPIGPFARAPDWGGTSFAPGFDAVWGTGHAWDDNGHGTHVSSTIAEATNNGVGAAGLAFGATLMPVKVCFSIPETDLQGLCATFSIVDGIDFAVRSGADVINMSLGGPSVSQSIRDAVRRASAANIVIVAAAGNDDGGAVDFPAAFPEVVAVGALDMQKQRAFYSDMGPELELVAPGGDITVDRDNDGLGDGVFQQTMVPRAASLGNFTTFGIFGFMGTSQATPHVSAVAALLISQGITDADAVRESMRSTAEDLGPTGRDNEFGYGMVRPAEALRGLGLGR